MNRAANGTVVKTTRFCQCGIHVWMLTGDKLETAMSIGLSTKLLSPELNTMIVEEHDSELLGKQLQRLIEYDTIPVLIRAT